MTPAPIIRRLLLLLGVLLACAPAARADVQSQIEASASSTLSTEVNAYATSQGPYSNGWWSTSDTACWACDQGGPTTAAATLYVLSGRSNATDLSMAEGTIDTAIATRQQPNGSFTDPSSTGEPTDIATEFFGNEFATTDRLLAPSLPAAEQAKWTQSLEAAADYLVTNGDVTYYTNGNINLGMAEFFELVYLDTGVAKYQQDYQQEWQFLLNPPQSKFPGDGLQITQQPTAADGSDGAGYLAENGPGGVGYDPEYTELQLEIASRLYLMSGDPNALWLTNLLANQLLQRVDESTWLLDTSGGTRHPDPNRYVNFLSPALTVLGLEGGRSDLAALAPAQVTAESTAYTQQPWQDYNPVFRRSLGNDVSTIALAAAPASVTTGLIGTAPPAGGGTTAADPTTTTPVATTPASTTTTSPASTVSGTKGAPKKKSAAHHKAKKKARAKAKAKAKARAAKRARRLHCRRDRRRCSR